MKGIIRYKRKGNFGHAGRPGQVGGSSSSLPGTVLPTMPMTDFLSMLTYNKKSIAGVLDNLKRGMFDTSGQMSTPKANVSKSEVKRYYEMADLFKRATSEKYAYQKPGETIADYLDNLMHTHGFSERKKLPRGVYRLHKPGNEAQGFDVRDPGGKAYMKLLDLLDEMNSEE